MFLKKLLLSIFFFAINTSIYSQRPNLWEIKAVFIFKIIENINWLEQDSLKYFHIRVISDSLVYNELRNLAMTQKLKNKKVYVTTGNQALIDWPGQVWYVGESSKDQTSKIFESLKGSQTLLITDKSPYQQAVMVNLTENKNKKSTISFEINKKNIVDQNFDISPSLLLLGGTEIDIRELYKKTEQELQLEVKKVEQKDLEITKHKQTIDIQTESIKQQQELLFIQQQKIKSNLDSINGLHIRVLNLNLTLKVIKNQIDTLSGSILLYKSTISNQKSTIDNHKSKIESSKLTLQKQQKEIIIYNHEIQLQQTRLNTLQTSISTREKAIFYISLLLLITILLGIIAFFLFWSNYKSKNLLIIKNKEIERQQNELKIQSELLIETNHELESFSYSVSHDLRAPLRGIDGFSQAIIDDFPPEATEQTKQYLHRIRAASQKMGSLIDDILRLSRISRQNMNFETIDLSEIAHNILTEILETTSDSQKYSFEIEPKLTVVADKNLIIIVLQNLLSNAVKYSSKTEHPIIRFGKIDINHQNSYFISDNGRGFNMNHSERLFTAFQRLHSNDEFPGTGIGLSIVKRIVLRHNGSIWAESEPFKGATFYFTLNTK